MSLFVKVKTCETLILCVVSITETVTFRANYNITNSSEKCVVCRLEVASFFLCICVKPGALITGAVTL